MKKNDDYFMSIALHMASLSDGEPTKVGAVIVGRDGEICAAACNSFPDGVDSSRPERRSRENGEKYFWGVCAERNAIYSAARMGTPLDGCRIYLTTFSHPCPECAKAIIQSGIKEVVTFATTSDDPYHLTPQYKKLFERSAVMLSEAGILVRNLSGK